jgi:hypothetical protein
MNCKPGDLAVIVRSTSGNEGKFVTVLRWIGAYTFYHGERLSDCWLVRLEQDMRPKSGGVYHAGQEHAFPDSWLKPIRDPGEDAKDETLQWKEVPKEGELTKEDAELLIEALREWAREEA